MRILGIDPGYETTGYTILDYKNNRFEIIKVGAIITKRDKEFSERLAEIFVDIENILEEYKPEYLAIEELFFNKNIKTAIKVAQARGVVISLAKVNGLEVFEYTPLQIKQAVCGYGRADKIQVQEMVKRILKIATVPKLDDVTDSMAIAICHAHSHGVNSLLKEKGFEIDK